MISNAYVEALYAGLEKDRVKVIERRRQKRAFYKSDAGIETICDLIKSSGLFSVVDPEDAVSAGTRNFVIGMLDEIGLFDEANLEKTVKYILSLPVFPEREDKE